MEPLQNSFSSFWDTLIGILPSIVGAILLIAIGWGIAKLVSIGIRKLLESLHFDKLGTKILNYTSLKIDQDQVKPSQWVGTFAFWIILLVFFMSASDTLGWNVVSASISSLVNYIPQLFSALLVFAIGMYLAFFVRSFVSTTLESLGMSASEILSEIIFYILLIIIGTTALEQAGIDTAIITTNISIILGGILLAFAIGFGYSSRELLANALSSFYVKDTFSVGQTIKIDGMVGKISHISHIKTIIRTDRGEFIIPTKRLLTENVERVDIKKAIKETTEKKGMVKTEKK
ncbi:MAG: mechanosensitive ion channel family protein [Bacteroidota bacterium]